MCKRDECPECGATALEACQHEPKNECAREVVKCSKCGATAAEACRDEA